MKKALIFLVVCLLLGLAISAVRYVGMKELLNIDLVDAVTEKIDGVEDGYTVCDGSARIDTGEIDTIELNWTAGEVKIQTYSGSEIGVEETAQQTMEQKQRLRYKVDGDTLYIRYSRTGLEHLSDKELKLLLPQTLKLDKLKLETVSAETEIVGLDTVEELEYNGISGSLTIDEADVMKIQAVSVSGDIALALTDTQELKLNSVSGKISVDCASGKSAEVEAKSVSGEMELRFGSLPEKIKTGTTSGLVEMYLPERSAFTLKLTTVSGELHSDFDSKSGIFSKTGASDADCEIIADSVSGAVEINADK